MNVRSTALITAGVVALTACNGGGGLGTLPQTSTPAKLPGGGAQATIVVRVPSAPAHASSINAKPAWISPVTQSVKIAVNGGTPTLIGLTPSSPGCVPASGSTPLTCTTALAAPVGTDTFAATFYDDTLGNGNKLASGVATATIVAGQANSVLIATSGIVGQLQVGIVNRFVNPGKAITVPVTVYVSDADGWQIMGATPYNEPVTITDSDPAGYTSLSLNGGAGATSVQLTQPSDTVTLTYNGTGVTNATITASANSVSSFVNHFTANQNVYVQNNNGSAYQISYFPINATAGTAPAGSFVPSGNFSIDSYLVGVDSTGTIYGQVTTPVGPVAQTQGVAAFAHGSNGTAYANPIWTKVLGPFTVDSSGNVYGATFSGSGISYTATVSVYDASNLTTPKSTLSFGPQDFTYNSVFQIAADASGNVYIVDAYDPAPLQSGNYSSEIRVFTHTGSGYTQSAVINGSNTGLDGSGASNTYQPNAIAVDANGNIFVPVYHSAVGTTSILEFSAGSNGNVAPIRVMTPTGGTLLSQSNYVATDWQGNVYSSNTQLNLIDVFSTTATTPTRTIGGTGVLRSPLGIAIGP